MGQRYCRMKHQKLLFGLPKLKVKMSKLEDVLSKLVFTQTYHRRGSGSEYPEAKRFSEKTSYFNVIGIHSARVLSYLKELNF